MSNDEPAEPPLTIAALRAELGLSLEAFGARIGLASKGNVSILERGGACSLPVALALEELSGGRLDAGALNEDVARARAAQFARLSGAIREVAQGEAA